MKMIFKFRDLFWIVLIVALAVGWWREHWLYKTQSLQLHDKSVQLQDTEDLEKRQVDWVHRMMDKVDESEANKIYLKKQNDRLRDILEWNHVDPHDPQRQPPGGAAVKYP